MMMPSGPRRRATTSSMSSTANMMRRMPSAFAGYGAWKWPPQAARLAYLRELLEAIAGAENRTVASVTSALPRWRRSG